MIATRRRRYAFRRLSRPPDEFSQERCKV